MLTLHLKSIHLNSLLRGYKTLTNSCCRILYGVAAEFFGVFQSVRPSKLFISCLRPRPRCVNKRRQTWRSAYAASQFCSPNGSRQLRSIHLRYSQGVTSCPDFGLCVWAMMVLGVLEYYGLHMQASATLCGHARGTPEPG